MRRPRVEPQRLAGLHLDRLPVEGCRHVGPHAARVVGRQYLVVRTRIPDRPGELIKLLQLCAAQRVNVVSVEHHREGMHISVAETEVELTVATRNREHCAEVMATLEAHGYPVEPVR